MLKIDNENNAELSALSFQDKIRLKIQPIRMVLNNRKGTFMAFLRSNNIKHNFRLFAGACGTGFYVVEIYNKEDLMLIALGLDNGMFRTLSENDDLYRKYDEQPETDKITNFDDEDYDTDFDPLDN